MFTAEATPPSPQPRPRRRSLHLVPHPQSPQRPSTVPAASSTAATLPQRPITTSTTEAPPLSPRPCPQRQPPPSSCGHNHGGNPHALPLASLTTATSPSHRLPMCPTRPVYLDCAGVTNPIGKWIDMKLWPIVKAMKTHLKDSFEFRRLIDNLGRMDPRAKLFTYDVKSTYTNIPIEYAVKAISEYV